MSGRDTTRNSTKVGRSLADFERSETQDTDENSDKSEGDGLATGSEDLPTSQNSNQLSNKSTQGNKAQAGVNCAIFSLLRHLANLSGLYGFLVSQT